MQQQRRLIVSLGVLLSWTVLAVLATHEECQEDDFEWRYTECDARDERWKVAVIKAGSDCRGGVVPHPTKAVNCTYSCSGGQYLRIDTNQCERCHAGTYSLGGGMRYQDFEKELPDGFTIDNFPPLLDDNPFVDTSKARCDQTRGWQISGGMLAYFPTNCTSVLSLSTRIKRKGSVEYRYRLPKSHGTEDLYFHVRVQNEQCHSVWNPQEAKMRDSKVRRKSRGEWHDGYYPLTVGQNVINWVVTARKELELAAQDRPIYIGRIDVFGVSAASSCTACPRGMYSSGGSEECTMCGPNTYADSLASSQCKSCQPHQYSGYGSLKCQPKPACTQDDYYKELSPCNAEGKTVVTYKWVEPHLCRTDMPGAASLPGTEQQSCPQCPLAMVKDGGGCAFCNVTNNEFVPHNSNKCQKCQPTTVPALGYYFDWWPQLPPHLKVDCQLVDSEEACDKDVTVNTWVAAGDKLHTAHPRRRGIIFLLLLSVQGFNDPLMRKDVEPSAVYPIGHVTFVFGTKCAQTDCSFIFAEKQKSGELEVIEAWNGTVPKRTYSHPVIRRRGTEFAWIFIRSGDETESDDVNYMTDEASMYTINVTNTVDGGAFECRSCPVHDAGTSCVPCAAGHYIDEGTHKCVVCPPDHELNVTSNRLGVSSCVPCAPNLHAKDGQTCRTNGQFELTVDGEHRKYDMSKLGDRHYEVNGITFYGHQGASYYHVFNASLFGNTMANCTDTYDRLIDPDAELSASVSAWFCRSTALFMTDTNGTNSIIYVSPAVVGARLVAITANTSYGDIKLPSSKRTSRQSDGHLLDVHFYYSSATESPSSSCPHGQAAVITARCQPNQNKTVVTLPVQCPDGTCDGCVYRVIVSSAYACPLCEADDYTEIKGECRNGFQNIHTIPDKHCVLSGAALAQQSKTVACKIFGVQMQIFIGVTAALAMLLCITVVVVCRRNKKLEYKYMKLVEGQGYGGQEGELPAAESCGLDSDEEDEDDASSGKVIFVKGGKTKRSGGLFGNRREKQALAFDTEDA